MELPDNAMLGLIREVGGLGLLAWLVIRLDHRLERLNERLDRALGAIGALDARKD